jgi:hypothetical protein
MEKLYGNRDSRALGRFYTQHVEAMTRESLHEKSAIAAELAHRDKQIWDLESRLVEKNLQHLKDLNELREQLALIAREGML